MIYNLQTIDSNSYTNPVEVMYIKTNISKDEIEKEIEKFNTDHSNIGLGYKGFVKHLRDNHIDVEIIEVTDVVFSEYDSS